MVAVALFASLSAALALFDASRAAVGKDLSCDRAPADEEAVVEERATPRGSAAASAQQSLARCFIMFPSWASDVER